MSNERGISLIESILAILIIGTMVFLMASIPNALMLLSKSKHLSLAREIAVKQIEDGRATSYANLAKGEVVLTDMRLSLLPQGSGTVVVGVQDAEGVWQDCDSSICANGEHVKQVSVSVNWQDNNKPQVLTLKTIIAEGGIDQ